MSAARVEAGQRQRHRARRPHSWRAWAPGAVPVIVAALGAVLSGAPAAHAVGVSPSPSPAFAGDAGDPDIVYSGGTYYAFSTGTALGNHIQALVSTSASSGYHSYTGTSFGSTALATPPAWETPDTQTSPSVIDLDGRWLMYYDAAVSPNAGDTGHNCISVAVGGTILSPSAPTFTDTSSGGLVCEPTGSIDPSAFVDPASGQAYLVWKQNDGGSNERATIWSQPLSADGLSLLGVPSALMYNNTVSYPWESTVEDPDMVYANGTYFLLFAAGVYTTAAYSEGITTCSGPTGPCGSDAQILTTYGSVLGPGGGSLFTDASGAWHLAYAAWQGGSAGCTSYACGAVRALFVAPASLTIQAACAAPATRSGYRMVASDGGIFSFGTLPFCGSMGGVPLAQPVVGMASTPDGGGYWEVASDGGIFAFGDARFFGSTGAVHLTKPVVGMASTPDGGGYWEVASDGGIFAFGDARFFGSTGAVHLTKPVVGMASTPDGGGYWEVASDGGIFAFGDARFFGSTGAVHLAKPVVGMASTPDGGGYWEVASDGGIFAFGDARFFGSTGAVHLTKPVVGMASTPDGGGYWEVASDGGIFAFGDARYFGSTGAVHLTKPVVGMAP